MTSSHERIESTVHRHAVRRREQQADGSQRTDQPAHGLLRLQRSVGNGVISRMLAQRAAPEEEDALQRSPDTASHSAPEVGLSGGPISEGLTGRINAKRGGGAALDSTSRASMEQAFGSSFADVRVHTDSESDSLNRSISAKAFTTGSDIFFSRDASPNDSTLLAHELTHVVQQRGSSPAGGGMTVGPAGDTHESAADSAAATVASGGAVAQRLEDDAAPQLAREAAPAEDELPA